MMNLPRSILACLAVLLVASPALAAPAEAPQLAPEVAGAPAADVFGVSLLSVSPDCQPKGQQPQATGTLDPTQECGACSQTGCQLNFIGGECGPHPRGFKTCAAIPTSTCQIDGGAYCRCLPP